MPGSNRLDFISAVVSLEETKAFINDYIKYKTTAGIIVVAPSLTVKSIKNIIWFHGMDALPR